MTDPRGREAPLSADEVTTILSICSPRGVLVGGQALTFWSDHLRVPRPLELVSGITADADFIGDATLARELGKRLGWRTWVATLDDATPQTAKVTRRLADGGVKQVDFLSGVAGLTTKDIARRAVEMEVPRIGMLRVMHPLDVMDSRIQNLRLLPAKRNRDGIAQARLSLDVARAFIRQEVDLRGERVALKLLERVVEIAKDIAALQVFLLYDIDPLRAGPLDDFRTTRALHDVRWPRIEDELRSKRDFLLRSTAKEKETAAKPKRVKTPRRR